MDQFPGNSQRAKNRPESAPPPEERQKVERITSAEAKPRRKSLGQKFKSTFIGGSARDTFEYMIVESVVPAMRDMMIDTLQGGVERLFNGESSRARRYSSAPSAYSNLPRTNYQSISRPPVAAAPATNLSRRARTQHDFRDIVIETRVEAQEVLDTLYEYLSRFGVVHVADLYDMTGIQSSHVDLKWGWQNLHGSGLVRLRDGRFLLKLPEPNQLD